MRAKRGRFISKSTQNRMAHLPWVRKLQNCETAEGGIEKRDDSVTWDDGRRLVELKVLALCANAPSRQKSPSPPRISNIIGQHVLASV